MATEFKKLSEVTTLENVADTAHVLVEENGEIYRAPKTSVGGSGGIKTAIIKDSGYDNAIAGVQSAYSSAPEYTYECINMTFEEAYQLMANGEPLQVLGMFTGEGAMNATGVASFLGTVMGVPCIMMMLVAASTTIALLYWTADGLSTTRPGA